MLKVMSYNLRYDYPDDGINRWDKRKDSVIELVRKYQPGIFGTQEGNTVLFSTMVRNIQL